MSRDEEIIKTLYVAKVLARRYSIAYDYVSRQDLYDLAEITIVEVYDKWQPERCTFKTFAWHCAEKAIKSYIVKRAKRYNVENPVELTESVQSTQNVENEVQAKLLLHSVLKYAATLSVLQRRIVMCLADGQSNISQISRGMKIDRTYAWRLKERAINRLKLAVGY